MKEETAKEYIARIASMGGKARAKKLSEKRRKEIGRAAIKARWDKAKGKT